MFSRSERLCDRFSGPCSTKAANGVAPAAIFLLFACVFGGSGNIVGGQSSWSPSEDPRQADDRRR